MKRDKVVSIFTHLHQRLHTTARNIAGDDNADDILQDAFCKLWTLKNLPSDQQQTEKIASTIVRNVSIDYRRSAERKTQSSIDKADTENSQENDIRELFVTVKHIIELQLSDMQRQVLWMRDYEGYSFAEVAEKMCITEEKDRKSVV